MSFETGHLPCKYKNVCANKRLQAQLIPWAMAQAEVRGACRNISEVMYIGMGPRPMANEIM